MAAKKIIKKDPIYIIISYFDQTVLSEEITKLLKEGYELVGGVCTTVAPNHQYKVLFTQALVLNN